MTSNQLDDSYTTAAVAALADFPVAPHKVELVAVSENVTFRVSASGGDYVLRLHRPGYNSIEELDSERQWTRALIEAGIPVPDSIATRDGRHFTLVDVPGTAEPCYAGLTRWIEGKPLRGYLDDDPGTDERQRIFGRIGELIAAMHNQATRWQEPPGFTRPRLDLDGLLGEAPRWGRFWEQPDLSAAERQLLLRTREKLRSALRSYGERPGNFGLTHADINPDNIVYDDGDLALIDFDDAAYGWHVYDISAALIDDRYAPDFEAIGAALLDGYRKHRPLEDRDAGMLPAFLLIRGMVTVGWFHQRPEHAHSSSFEKFRTWVVEQCSTGTWWSPESLP